MIITVKTMKNVITGIVLSVLIPVSTLSWAGDMVFTGYPVSALKVIEVNEEIQTVLFESPNGETATVTTGDVIGQEELKVVKIQKGMVMLEESPNNFGMKRIRSVLVRPIGASAAGQ